VPLYKGDAVALATLTRDGAEPAPSASPSCDAGSSHRHPHKVEAHLSTAAAPLTAEASRKLCRSGNATLTTGSMLVWIRRRGGGAARS